MPRSILAALLFAAVTVCAAGDDTEFFESRIRPVLIDQCYGCHNSANTAEGELALDFRDGIRKGGSGGALLVPGDPAGSRLIAILKHEVEGLEMPEDRGKLDDNVIADFEKWIASGATDPRDQPPTADEIQQVTSWEATLRRRKEWWSFQPIEKPELPKGDGVPIDRFVRSRLSEVGLSQSESAEPETLIRRLYFTLIGLPPTPSELQQWLSRYTVAKTTSSQVTEELVDHLLQSDQFGPRWARHWMDWIRYAESHGSEGDPVMNNAWMYRDYMIRALNDDIPYDQLVREHLAGDLLQNPRINDKLGLNESLLGSIQLRMVFHGFSPTDALDEKVRFVDDQVNTISKAFLGLTVSCARCHDHKFDAISQADYYAMFGIFAACRPGRSIADSAERRNTNKQELAALVPKIRSAIAQDWLDSSSRIGKRIRIKIKDDVVDGSLLAIIKNWQTKHIETDIADAWNSWATASRANTGESPIAIRHWNFSKPTDFNQWIQKGNETTSQSAGSFAVALSGDAAIEGVYPSGVYSHLLSTHHPLRITSPDVELDGKYDYWVQAIGDRDAATRYVTQDYPRTGTVYSATKLTRSWKWHRLKLDYWEGDTAHFELATGPDIPLLASNEQRSWFGARQVMMVDHDSPLPSNRVDFASPIIEATSDTPKTFEASTEAVAAGIIKAVEAWKSRNCSDSQALLIDHAVRTGLLVNRINTLPNAKPLIQQYRQLESQIPVPRRVPGLDDVPDRTQPLFIRGNHKRPADIIPRRFLEAINSQPYPTSVTGRRQFAEDILHDDNPLSRRVIVNRVWSHMFGKGIVATPDNFGKLGAKPTHPKLLDYLATQFVDDGWSLKNLIRKIATSETWQQTSKPSKQAREVDPDNLLLSHANVRRLEAEAIRDAMLRASGEISLDVQGEPVSAKSNRRSVFMRVKRNSLDPMLRAFDFPEPHSAVGRRDVTNVPAQSLLMMNSPEVAKHASTLVDKSLQDRSAESDRDRVRKLYLQTLSRQPSSHEVDLMLQHRSQTQLTLTQLIRERADLRARIDILENQVKTIIERKRAELVKSEQSTPKPVVVPPYAQWEFDKGVNDSVNGLNGQVNDGASIADGKLVVNGGGYGTTTPITKSIKAKTLEAWVQLDNLEQRGGGVVTLQKTDGSIFDSIVFAERQNQRWMAGSDGFRRTKDFAGTAAESEAADNVIQVAISYHADGTVIGYRDGKRYGKPFKTSPPVEYKAGEAVVSFGVRHFPNVGNHRLAGKIERAALYDRAMTDQEISESFAHWSGKLSDARVIDALSETDRVRVKDLKAEIEMRKRSIDSLGTVPDKYDERHAWTDLTRTIFMLKEFIYVR